MNGIPRLFACGFALPIDEGMIFENGINLFRGCVMGLNEDIFLPDGDEFEVVFETGHGMRALMCIGAILAVGGAAYGLYRLGKAAIAKREGPQPAGQPSL